MNQPGKTIPHPLNAPFLNTEVVRRVFGTYAERGVFRSFSEIPAAGSAVRFRFQWFRDVAFVVEFRPRTRTLAFVDLLPEVPARSAMDRDLRAFVKGRTARAVPEHRRVDVRKMTAACRNRGGRISIVITLKDRHAEYGVRRAVNLVQEILMDFLNDDRFTQYQVAHFSLDPELA